MNGIISIDFVGDSMVERWDLGDYFPSWDARNFGRSGSGADYLEMLRGRFVGRQVVVVSGINDNRFFSANEREAYADRYMDAVGGLGADRVMLFSVQPCSFGRNDDIEAFNAIIRERTNGLAGMVYIDVYSQFIEGGRIRGHLFSDGLHLSHYGYQILTSALAAAL